jgi:hypothetical protein
LINVPRVRAGVRGARVRTFLGRILGVAGASYGALFVAVASAGSVVYALVLPLVAVVGALLAALVAWKAPVRSGTLFLGSGLVIGGAMLGLGYRAVALVVPGVVLAAALVVAL